MYLTDSEEARLLTLTLTSSRMALVTAQGTESTAGTEVTGGGYVRAAIAPSAPTGGAATNASPILFLDLPACSLVGWELWSQDGQRRWFGYWAPTVGLWNGDAITTAQPHGLANGQQVVFVLGQAPTGLAANTKYYLRDVTSTTFKVASSPGGAALTIGNNGSTTFGRVLELPAGESFQVSTGNLTLALD